MGKILIVAEKPSVGRDIAKVMGCKNKEEGYIYSDKYIVSWALGHLVTLYEPEDYDVLYKKWSFKTLPILPDEMKLKAIKKTSQQLSVLKKLMNAKDTDYIICATDSGREGELIFRYIYKFVKCKKVFKRLWISSMTDEAIKEGMSNVKDSKEYDNIYISAKCRSEADWLVGMNASRAYTLKHNVLLSVGRVQTPTLFMIVKRQKEIENFVSKDYYEVLADYGVFKGTWFDKDYNNTKIQDIKLADEIKNNVSGKKGTVILIDNENKSVVPPLLYDLTELQRTANRIYGFSAKKTLDLAQNLYEKHKMITYPRTDSRYITNDMPNKVVSTLKKISDTNYSVFINKLNLDKLSFTNRIVDNSKVRDHFAIIPSGKLQNKSVTADELKVYDLIVKRFIAVFYPAYKYVSTAVVVECGNYKFVSKGKTELSKGWHEVEPLTEKENKNDIPKALKEGQIVDIISAEVLKKKTQPPKPYTEAGILSAMENAGRDIEDEVIKEQLKDSGIGTPATRAAIIERLISVGYIKRKGKSLIPEQKGINLCLAVPDELKSPQTTGRWEKGLSSISKGNMQPQKFMASINRFVDFIINDAINNKDNIEFEKETVKIKKSNTNFGKCPICGGSVLENTKAFYCSNWKNGCGFTVWKNVLDIYGNTMDTVKIKSILKNGKAENIKITLPQTGEKGVAELVLNKDNNFAVEIKNFKRGEFK